MTVAVAIGCAFAAAAQNDTQETIAKDTLYAESPDDLQPSQSQIQKKQELTDHVSTFHWDPIPSSDAFDQYNVPNPSVASSLCRIPTFPFDTNETSVWPLSGLTLSPSFYQQSFESSRDLGSTPSLATDHLDDLSSYYSRLATFVFPSLKPSAQPLQSEKAIQRKLESDSIALRDLPSYSAPAEQDLYSLGASNLSSPLEHSKSHTFVEEFQESVRSCLGAAANPSLLPYPFLPAMTNSSMCSLPRKFSSIARFADEASPTFPTIASLHSTSTALLAEPLKHGRASPNYILSSDAAHTDGSIFNPSVPSLCRRRISGLSSFIKHPHYSPYASALKPTGTSREAKSDHPSSAMERYQPIPASRDIIIGRSGIPLSTDKGTLWDLKDPPQGPSGRPSYAYVTLIRYAILGSQTKRLGLQEIYDSIEERYPFFKTAGNGWKNSVRHNLSLNKCFKREGRHILDPGKGSYWTVDVTEELSTARVRNRRKKTEGAASNSFMKSSPALSSRMSSPSHSSEGLGSEFVQVKVEMCDSPISIYHSDGSDSEDGSQGKPLYGRAASESDAFPVNTITCKVPHSSVALTCPDSASVEEAALLQSFAAPSTFSRFNSQASLSAVRQ